MRTLTCQIILRRGARAAVPLAAACLLAAIVGAGAGGVPALSSGGFEAFQIIGQKNVFDAGRTSRRAASGEPVPPPRTATLTLVGTMSCAQGDVAFFDSGNSEFRKAVHIGDRLGGCRVEAIAHDHVRLQAGDAEIDLPVQRQLRRENEGPWELVAEAENRPLPVAETFSPVRSVSPSVAKDDVRQKAPPDGPTDKQLRKIEQTGLSDKQLRKLEKEAEEMLKPEKVSKEYARELKELSRMVPAVKVSKKPKRD
ncbi:MAG: hypothetical protein HZA89_11180 [Verrucomicrobia bacterium]|nr:hypothetical protein [Verrucomicrobiota bacterium]